MPVLVDDQGMRAHACLIVASVVLLGTQGRSLGLVLRSADMSVQGAPVSTRAGHVLVLGPVSRAVGGRDESFHTVSQGGATVTGMTISPLSRPVASMPTDKLKVADQVRTAMLRHGMPTTWAPTVGRMHGPDTNPRRTN